MPRRISPRIGREGTGQQVDQRGLARPVRADDAEPVAAQDAQGQVVDDSAPAVGLRDVPGFGDERAGGFALARRQHRLPHRAAVVAALLAQGLQVGEATHVALAPGGHAVAQPVFLVSDLAVELVLVALLLLEEGVAPRLEAREALLDAAGHAAVEPDGGARQGRKKAAVVADDDEGRARALQLGFQPLDGGEVEMVGGLVEQQDVGLGRERLGECGPARLAARQALGVLRAVET
ncbi:hypothetical protein M2440_003583 [Methylorubrum extorquens]|nr:hypothetical protein [Methylorubrum extorquens]